MALMMSRKKSGLSAPTFYSTSMNKTGSGEITNQHVTKDISDSGISIIDGIYLTITVQGYISGTQLTYASLLNGDTYSNHRVGYDTYASGTTVSWTYENGTLDVVVNNSLMAFQGSGITIAVEMVGR